MHTGKRSALINAYHNWICLFVYTTGLHWELNKANLIVTSFPSFTRTDSRNLLRHSPNLSVHFIFYLERYKRECKDILLSKLIHVREKTVFYIIQTQVKVYFNSTSTSFLTHYTCSTIMYHAFKVRYNKNIVTESHRVSFLVVTLRIIFIKDHYIFCSCNTKTQTKWRGLNFHDFFSRSQRFLTHLFFFWSKRFSFKLHFFKTRYK